LFGTKLQFQGQLLRAIDKLVLGALKPVLIPSDRKNEALDQLFEVLERFLEVKQI
jgi:hypothetical protein